MLHNNIRFGQQAEALTKTPFIKIDEKIGDPIPPPIRENSWMMTLDGNFITSSTPTGMVMNDVDS